MYDVVVKKFTVAISSPDEFLSTFRVIFPVFGTGEDRDIKFGTEVDHGNGKSQPTNDKPFPERGVVSLT